MTSFKLKALAFAAALPVAALASPALATQATVTTTGQTMVAPTYAPITVAEVEAAQIAWGNALVAISTAHDTDGPAASRRLAEAALDTAYGYSMGPVLFKPTLTSGAQTFRTTREGALSYFVGGNRGFSQDSGFALKSWRSYEITNAGILITGNSATSMGNVTFTDRNGNRTTVDKTWGFVRGPDGRLLIVLHHSSLPYSPG